jgi:signal transduction histidine kinase
MASQARDIRARLALSAVAALVIASILLLIYHLIVGARRAEFIERSREETALVLAVFSGRDSSRAAQTIAQAARYRGRVEILAVSDGQVTASNARLSMSDVPASVRVERRSDDLPAADAPGGLRYLVIGGRTPDNTTDLFYSTARLNAGIAALRPRLVLAWFASAMLVAAVVEWNARRRMRRLAAHHESERQFNADMAHELRTPLATMVTTAALIDNAGPLPPDLEQPVRLMVAQTRRLKALVDNLLEIARLEAGDYDLHPELLSPAALTRAVIRANGWRDHVDLIVDDEVAVFTDRRALVRVLMNLIVNALHHGSGRARVRITREHDHARIDVIDDGPGIPADEIHKVFQRFSVRGPRRSGDSGLGLAIARENANLLDADLTVHSIVGIGTRFTLHMPAVRDEPGTTRITEGRPGCTRVPSRTVTSHDKRPRRNGAPS